METNVLSAGDFVGLEHGTYSLHVFDEEDLQCKKEIVLTNDFLATTPTKLIVRGDHICPTVRPSWIRHLRHVVGRKSERDTTSKWCLLHR